MDAGMAWTLVALVVGLLAVAGLVVLLVRWRRVGTAAGDELTGEQWIALGVVFMGAGVTLAITIGPHMYFLVAIGVIYMAIGAGRKRRDPK